MGREVPNTQPCLTSNSTEPPAPASRTRRSSSHLGREAIALRSDSEIENFRSAVALTQTLYAWQVPAHTMLYVPALAGDSSSSGDNFCHPARRISRLRYAISSVLRR